MLALEIGLGLLLIWIGALIWGFADDPDVADIGMAVRAFGMLVLVGALLLGALARSDIDRWVRVMMIFSATLMLIFIGFWTGFWSVLGVNLDFSGLM
jgi:zinc transporter ZupT